MPFDPNCLRNTREQFVLQNIEGFQVNEYMGRSNWVRHEFKNYRDAIRKYKNLKEMKSKVMIFACRQGEVEEMTTAILDRKFFKRYQYKGSYVKSETR